MAEKKRLRVKAASAASSESPFERTLKKIIDEDVAKIRGQDPPRVPLTVRESEYARPKDPEGLPKRTTQHKIQARSRIETQEVTVKPQTSSPKPAPTKPAPKIPVKLQQRVAAEVQQERHAQRIPQKPAAESPGFDIKKPKARPAPKSPTLRERAVKAISERRAARAATKVPAKGVIGKVLAPVRAVGRVARPIGLVADVATIGAAGYEGVRAASAGRTLERQAAHAERRHGLKVKVKKPSLLKAMIAHPISGEGPKVDVEIVYPKPKPLSERAKRKLRSLGQM